MQVIIYAQDLSGRNDDGYYTKSDLSSALDIFFGTGETGYFLDTESEHPLSKDDATAIFGQDRRVTFYNEVGEKVVISYDSSK